MPKLSLLTLAALAVSPAFAFVAEKPSAVHRTDNGWSFTYALPRYEEANFLKIDVAGSAKSWSVRLDDAEVLKGDAVQSGHHEVNLPKLKAFQFAQIDVEADREPVLKRVEFCQVPFADAIDPKLLKVTNVDETCIAIDFGRETALAGFTYAGDFNEKCEAWVGDLATDAKRDYGHLENNKLVCEKKGGATEVRLHNTLRTRFFFLRDKKGKLDAAKLTVKVVPYDYAQHITKETWDEKLKRLEWWTEARFGLFIHFGLYASPARQEWVKTLEQISEEKYQEYFDNFNPDRFDAKAWARAAKAAGMKYAVLTSKHHEGFCLFDSKFTDYKITNTKFKRDLVKEFVEAFRAEGLKVGFYYSVIDWHHPDYTLDYLHPRRVGGFWDPNSGDYVTANKGRDMAKYREYVKNQVTELLTNYGPIDIMWFDFSYPMVGGKCRDDWDSVGLVKLVRKLAPNIIIDNRLDLPDYEDGWDFATPEQNREPFWVKVNGRKVPWETCQTFSGSWGYARDEKGWKSSFQVIEQLVSTVSKGGNVIMNVGPTAAGEFDYRAMERLADYGKWLHACGDSIYGCTAAPEEFVAPNGTILTYNPKTNKLYMHMLSWQWGEFAVPFMSRVKYVQLLNDKSEIRVVGGKLQLPTDKPPVEIPVVEFTLR